ncbi:MAG: YlxR family protein [Cellulomonadaceae bacterium]
MRSHESDLHPSHAPVSEHCVRTPVRTCVGCRGLGARTDLVRLVAQSTTFAPGAPASMVVVVDERADLPGRGAWLHPRPRCVELAVRRRAITRALRISASAELGLVRGWFAENVAPTGATMNDTSTSVDKESGSEADGHPMSPQR